MSRRIANLSDYPFAVARFERVGHAHAGVQFGIVLRMEADGGMSYISVERDVGGRNVHTLKVETGMGLESVDDGGLHFFLRFHIVTARGNEQKESQAEW